MKKLRSHKGQAIVEFAVLLPIFVVMVLGIVEVGYALLEQHVVTKLSREGSNLISRNTTLPDAITAMKAMASFPVDFDHGKVILSVLKVGATTGTSNYNKLILYQRYSYGSLSAPSKLGTQGAASFGSPPDYVAPNSDADANLRVTNAPASLSLPPGGLVYVTEVYSQHKLITPLDRFGISVPTTLYSIAYF